MVVELDSVVVVKSLSLVVETTFVGVTTVVDCCSSMIVVSSVRVTVTVVVITSVAGSVSLVTPVVS